MALRLSVVEIMIKNRTMNELKNTIKKTIKTIAYVAIGIREQKSRNTLLTVFVSDRIIRPLQRE